MATRKKAEPETEEPKVAAGKDTPHEAEAPHKDDTLQKAAKAIGSALGTMAVKTGIAHPPPTPPKKKIGKLVKKTKQRLPRKEKKLAKKKLAKSAK